MKTNPILEEVWRIKDQLAAESGYDVDRFVEQLRPWSAMHPHSGRMVRTAGELRQLVAEKERERAKESAMSPRQTAAQALTVPGGLALPLFCEGRFIIHPLNSWPNPSDTPAKVEK